MKKILVISHYGSSDPPTINTIRSLENLGYNLKWLDYSSSFSQRQPSIKHLISNIFIFRILGKKVSYVVLKNYYAIFADIVFCFGYESSMLLMKSPKKSILNLYDIPPIDVLNNFKKNTLNRIRIENKKYRLVTTSDVLKKEMFLKMYGIECEIYRNLPSDRFGQNVDFSLFKKKLKKEYPVLNKETLIMVRAGGIGPDDMVFETLRVIRENRLNVLFFIMGRISDEYHQRLSAIVDDLSLHDRVKILRNPTDNMWENVLAISHLGHSLQARSLDKDISNLVQVNSILSNNRIYQFLACGVPFIYSDSRLQHGIEVFEDCSYFVEGNDKCLETHLELALKWRQNLANSIILKMKADFKSDYTWEKQFNHTMNKYVY